MSYVTDRPLCELIARLCRDPCLRIVGAWPQHPSRWHPYQVIDPRSGTMFTEESAWCLVAELIEALHALRIEQLRQPPGLDSYVLIKDLQKDKPNLYVKITLSKSGKRIIGRSFHYSDH
jgi:hypothetical protein